MTKYFRLKPKNKASIISPLIFKTIAGTNQHVYVIKILKTSDGQETTLGMIVMFGSKSFIEDNFTEINRIEAFKELI